MALGSPEELDILGIVTVAGNVPLSRTTYNARQILELAARTDVPLYAGCARPMRRKLVTAEHVHGETGLDGPSLPPPVLSVLAVWRGLRATIPCRAGGLAPPDMFLGSAGKGRFFVPA
jgi:purine nucleosidase